MPVSKTATVDREAIARWADGLTDYQRFGLVYHDDPRGFARDCVAWGAGGGLTHYQSTALGNLATFNRESVRGPHGLGKTVTAALAVWWFVLTRDALGQDWKVPTTASSWHQLSKYLWPEIHKWHRALNWNRIGRGPLVEGDELLDGAIKMVTGQASAMASNDHAKMEGAHADEVLVVFDEAKTIPAPTWDAVEGVFSTGNCYALAISTPAEPVGRFYEIHSRRPGYEDWHVDHVTVADAIAAGRVSEEWVNARRRQWGDQSAVFLNRVMGEFASSEEDNVIPLSWVEAAVERWHAFMDSEQALGPLTCIGVDVARSGSDLTVMAPRYGEVISELRESSQADTMSTTGKVAGVLEAHAGYAVVDVIGIGAGVVDRLREEGHPVIAFNAAERSEKTDRSGELHFANKRAEVWWGMRERLDPAFNPTVCLPPHDLLIGDLTAPKWRVLSGGKILVEAKADIKKRLGRSTDHGDAVVQSFYVPPPVEETYFVTWEDNTEISPY